MVNEEKAIEFIRHNGNPLAEAQLDWILQRTRPSYAVTFKLFEDQRHDGSFAPFWAPDNSSIDATCYRLAQAEGLGLNYTDTQV